MCHHGSQHVDRSSGGRAADDDLEARRKYFHSLLVFTKQSNDSSWYDSVATCIERFGAEVKPDLDFVVGKSTDGVLYFEEDSAIYLAALTILTSTREQLKECMPAPNTLSRGWKKRSEQMMAALSDLRALQGAADEAKAPACTDAATHDPTHGPQQWHPENW